ncbi:lipopolysaccharide biosynthesis protein [Haloarcula amylovorans]|uniref:lipopolysaccharide biosynthesis protein n=1 Tax=Haloarcula amylovorans TaxID=2562280 RepID=UPI0010762AC2|nr:oligosaccharide flippase family protein [Halomicroarcula amylolytica]
MDLGRSTAKVLVAKFGNAFLFFGAITYFTRMLLPEELSTFFLYLALLGLLSIPADLGMRGALEKRLSEGQAPSSTLGSALAFKLGTLAVVCTGVWLGRSLIRSALGMPYVTLLVAGLVVQELARFYLQAIRGELRVGETASIEFSRRIVWVGLAVLLLNLGWGSRGILVALICGRTVEFLRAFHRCDTAIGRPDVDRIRSLLAFSKFETFTVAGGRVYQWMDVVVIGFFLSGRFVSAYEVAWQLTLLVLLFSKSIELNLFPQISRWDADSSTDRIENTVSRALGFVTFVSVPALVGAFLYARPALDFIFGPEYTIASTVLVILMVEKLVQSYNDIVGASIRALDRPDLTARATVSAVGLNLVASPVLVVTIGFEGAALATAGAWLVNALLQTRYLSRFLTLSYPTDLVCWYALSSLGMGAVLVAVRTMVPVDGLVALLAHVGLGVCVYLVLSIAIPSVRDRILYPGVNAVRG